MSIAPTEPQSRPLTVAFIGNPNTGKSTLFSAVSGLQTRVGNFPGVTVEKKIGRTSWNGRSLSFVDLPGTYSLSPRSLDEMVSVDVLLGDMYNLARPDAVVCIVDAANLERNLYLVSQVLDLGLPVVLALNMWDVVQSRGLTIDVEALRQRLGIPVVVTEAHRRRGLDELRQAVVEAAGQPAPESPELFPPEFCAKCDELKGQLAEWGEADTPDYLIERMILDGGGSVETRFCRRHGEPLANRLREIRTELQEAGCRVPVVEAKVRYAWARSVLEGVLTRPAERPQTLSDRIDFVLTHRVAGIAVFCALMFVVFQAIYTWAGPFMDVIETGQSWLSDQVAGVMAPGAFRSLLIDGVIAGVGGVVIFLPQIVLLFFFIALLEDSGYMARAAFLMDRLMSKVGLSGKSFVPLMSSFACAIPGVMATRVIENRRDRMVTILVAPLMSCSARLPVYLLLIGAFVPATSYLGGWIGLQGLVLFAMSSVGALVAIPVAWLLKKTFFRGETPPFVMELPSYKWPSPRVVIHRVYDRGKAFLVRAGTLIFATSIVVWALGYFPADHTRHDQLQTEIEALQAEASPNAEAEQRLKSLEAESRHLSGELIAGSFLGRMGHAIEPVVKPLGWDWKIGVGAIASFPAREVIIATLGTIYSLGGDVDEEDEGLKASLKASKWPDGTKVFNVPVALSIMVFFALCAQCAATLMIIKRETNSWRWPIFTFVYMTALAYVAALVTYQVGMLFV